MKSFFIVAFLACGVCNAAQPVTVTTNAADVAGCTPLGLVHSGGLNFGFLSGDASLKKHAVELGGDTVLRTSSKATDWQASGVAYRCGK